MSTTYLITGATGQLGQKVTATLAKTVPAAQIRVLARKEADVAALRALGYDARLASYTDTAALSAALKGVDRLLLISSSEVGQRAVQHRNVIDAAKAEGVSFIAYTSILRADSSPMALAGEHLETEAMLAASGLSFTLLRNGWYSENITMTAAQDLELGQHFGAAGAGKFSTASRQDYAEAAVAVLLGGHDGTVLELAGDSAVTLSDYAAILSKASGKPVTYTDLPQADFAAALKGAGLPEGLAEILADSDAKAAEGWLFDDSKTLSNLIGRPTTPIGDLL
ncbi:Quinone oxidoreductase 2 [Aquimixticola soesokkakensis]|uniref:Quinone oxidoreductase 2 n=1 Tax=Aquimixticola soesokkakensis TaxID=1519096 RepID=A0A1Y5SDJ9_9RHOB|nr:SDR family oxidoreductase [Aquimixticola soesokkakensis]SLN37241.1 Quinone oxidoreductase 2 [Aquimixticola soesokkakensis]